jgi:hypothetical protein
MAAALQLRQQGYTYEQIGKHLRVGKAQAARDVTEALDRVITEPARDLLKLELRRCDELMAAFYDRAADGDINCASMLLKIMAHRAHLLGWGTKEQVAQLTRLTITDASAGNGEPRSLAVEFILPGNRVMSLDTLGTRHTRHDAQPAPSSSPSRRIAPSPDDLVLERAGQQPSAFAKGRGGFDWS